MEIVLSTLGLRHTLLSTLLCRSLYEGKRYYHANLRTHNSQPPLQHIPGIEELTGPKEMIIANSPIINRIGKLQGLPSELTILVGKSAMSDEDGLPRRSPMYMAERGCAPNVITYTELVDGLCKMGKTEQAYKHFTVMQEKGCHPDVITYTAMMDGLGKEGKIDQAIELLQQMVEESCAPDSLTYSALINHCCNAGKLYEAQKLLHEMKLTLWPPYVKGFHGLSCNRSKVFKSLDNGSTEILTYTTLPILAAYSALVCSLCNGGQMKLALSLQREIMSLPLDLHRTSVATMYAVLIKGLCKLSNMEKTFDLYREMTERHCIPETTVFAHLISGLCVAGKRDEALELLHSISNMVPSWHAITTVPE